jgi:hypothetical protein
VSVSLPTELLIVAGVLALILVWPRLKAQPSNVRLIAEALGKTLVKIAIVWAAWIGLYLVEQRW